MKMGTRCSWCRKGVWWFQQHKLVVVLTSADSEHWKKFILCPSCFELTTSWKGLYLARVEPGEPFEGGDVKAD